MNFLNELKKNYLHHACSVEASDWYKSSQEIKSHCHIWKLKLDVQTQEQKLKWNNWVNGWVCENQGKGERRDTEEPGGAMADLCSSEGSGSGQWGWVPRCQVRGQGQVDTHKWAWNK